MTTIRVGAIRRIEAAGSLGEFGKLCSLLLEHDDLFVENVEVSMQQ